MVRTVAAHSKSPLISILVSARVVLSQVFENESESPTGRAKYVFPLPASAAACAFELEHADGRVIFGIAKEKSEAAEAFQSALNAGKTAGLVEWVTDDSMSRKHILIILDEH
jgi:hypothetical protein